MKIEFDADKDRINLEKHDISLAAAQFIEWETLWKIEDTRYDYGELRMIGFAYIGLRLFCVVFTDRADIRRIISLRKANKREVKRYANT